MIIVQSPISKYLKKLFSIIEWVFPLVKALPYHILLRIKVETAHKAGKYSTSKHRFTHFESLSPLIKCSTF
jgi:hypothetical protein